MRPGETLALRFSDRFVNGNDTTPPQGGDDSVEIRLGMNSGGNLSIQDRDYETNSLTQLQTLPFNPPADADRVVLRLSYAAADSASNGQTPVTASFDFLDDGGVVVDQQSFDPSVWAGQIDADGNPLGTILNGEEGAHPYS
jgi:hypothetical protein